MTEAVNFDPTWKIMYVEYLDEYMGHEKVVYNVHWRVEIEHEGFKGWNFGNIYLNIDNIEEFINYDDVTHEDIVAWLIEEKSTDGTIVDMVTTCTEMALRKDPMYNRTVGIK